jgi:hypothetical protein
MKINLLTQTREYIQPKHRYDYSTHLLNLKKNHIVDYYILKMDTQGLRIEGQIFIDSVLKYLCDSTKFEVNQFQIFINYRCDSASFSKYCSGLQNSILEILKKYLKHSHQPIDLFAIMKISYVFLDRNNAGDGTELTFTIHRNCEGIRTLEGLWLDDKEFEKVIKKEDRKIKKKLRKQRKLEKKKGSPWGVWGQPTKS